MWVLPAGVAGPNSVYNLRADSYVFANTTDNRDRSKNPLGLFYSTADVTHELMEATGHQHGGQRKRGELLLSRFPAPRFLTRLFNGLAF
jgi:hypothetical protein